MAYTPPAINAINFELDSHTPPALTAIDFDLSQSDYPLVQSAKVVATAVNSQAISFAATPAVGNLIVVAVATFQGDLGTGAVTDNQGNTYTRRSKAELTGTDMDVAIYDALAATSSGTFTVTINPDGSSADITVIIMEFDGNAASSVFDQQNSGTGTSTSPSSGNITPTVDGCLLIGAMTHGGTDRTLTEEPGWLLVDENEGGSSNVPIHVEIKVQGTASAEDADWTIGTGSVEWGACIVSMLPYTAPSGVTVEPDPADAAADTVNPAVILGAITLTPGTADAAADTVNPAVILGAIMLTPGTADAAADTVNPAVILGAITLTPGTADAAADTVNPVVVIGSPGGVIVAPDPADARVDTVDPLVIAPPPVVVVEPGGGSFSLGRKRKKYEDEDGMSELLMLFVAMIEDEVIYGG